jgi:hypothetical protein
LRIIFSALGELCAFTHLLEVTGDLGHHIFVCLGLEFVSQDLQKLAKVHLFFSNACLNCFEQHPYWINRWVWSQYLLVDLLGDDILPPTSISMASTDWPWMAVAISSEARCIAVALTFAAMNLTLYVG